MRASWARNSPKVLCAAKSVPLAIDGAAQLVQSAAKGSFACRESNSEAFGARLVSDAPQHGGMPIIRRFEVLCASLLKANTVDQSPPSNGQPCEHRTPWVLPWVAPLAPLSPPTVSRNAIPGPLGLGKVQSTCISCKAKQDKLSEDLPARCKCIRHTWGRERSSTHMGRLGW